MNCQEIGLLTYKIGLLTYKICIEMDIMVLLDHLMPHCDSFWPVCHSLYLFLCLFLSIICISFSPNRSRRMAALQGLGLPGVSSQRGSFSPPLSLHACFGGFCWFISAKAL